MKNTLIPIGIFVCLASLIVALSLPKGSYVEKRFGKVIFETRSDFSHIRVREKGDARSLLFVDQDGAEQCQSSIDLAHPHELQLAYSESIFGSLLFRYPQEHVLIVGLGGGGMVRFLNHALPETRVEAVEIDPLVVEIAEDYFETKNGSHTTIHTADAFVFLAEDRGPFDAIYMDAFLKPPAESGLEQKTQRLKTITFLEQLQSRLKPGGLLAFNLIETDPSTAADLSAIREAFPTVYEITVPGTGNLVVIASTLQTRWTREELSANATALDGSGFPLSFKVLLENLRP